MARPAVLLESYRRLPLRSPSEHRAGDVRHGDLYVTSVRVRAAVRDELGCHTMGCCIVLHGINTLYSLSRAGVWKPPHLLLFLNTPFRSHIVLFAPLSRPLCDIISPNCFTLSAVRYDAEAAAAPLCGIPGQCFCLCVYMCLRF